MTLLEVKELHKTFAGTGEELSILENISFSMEKGESLVITGQSGSGKSTLLNLLAGLDAPTSGSILCSGSEITAMNEDELARFRSRSLGFIFQFHFLLKDFTALENICIPGRIAGLTSAEAEERGCILLEEVGLSDRADHYPSQLSGGERQRIALGRALMNDPDLLLADEPTGNLDSRNSSLVEEILFSLVEKHQKTLILVTHDLQLAQRGKRSVNLHHGILEAL